MIAEAAARALGRPLARAQRVPGGDINDAWRLELEGGLHVFVKARAGAAPGEYATEAAGLAWLADGGARIPVVLAVDDAFLALEWIDGGRLDAAGEELLGRELAHLHRSGAPAFGAPPPDTASRPPGSAAPVPGHRNAVFAGLRLGTVELPAATADDWPAFYAEHRLAPLLRLATDRGALPRGGVAAVERVIEDIDQLAGPAEPPARLHGDLWGGNVLAGADGRARLIDPAAYGGHREVDLAMLQLFGAPAPRTLAAYDEVYPRATGHAARVPLFQLLPLLVHAVLFGGGYGSSAVAAARRAAAA